MGSTTLPDNKTFNYLAFFDLDRTITKAVSGRVLALRAFRNGLLNRRDIATGIFISLAYRFGFADPAKIMEKMTSWVKGLAEDELTNLCHEVVQKDLIPSIHPEVYHEIRMHKSKKARIIILSTTLTEICRKIAEHLEIDDVICSRLEIINGYLTGNPVGKLCYGDEKRLRIKEYCERNDRTPDEAWYYADAFVDFPALNFIGFPVCINPERKLENRALKKGWKIYYWKGPKN
jgi:HAD superfamily hydrolase (TIGR01490 family)